MNKNIFGSAQEPVKTVNKAGGEALALPPDEALAQLACTGFLHDTFYASAKQNLDDLLAAASKCSQAYVGRVAQYARKHGFMKDSPTVLIAYLFAQRSSVLTQELFNEVIDNAKMLSNFVRVIRSGVLGRKSLGTKGKRLIQSWFHDRDCDYIWRQSVAKDPRLADIISLAHVKPKTTAMERTFKAFMGEADLMDRDLPPLVAHTVAFRKASDEARATMPVPNVPFQMVDGVKLTKAHWADLIRFGGFQFVRMNLATMKRHGLFEDAELVEEVALKLKDRDAVLKSRQFPYQIFQAIEKVREIGAPAPILEALDQALTISLENVPEFPGKTVLALDISGSMQGYPIQVASLFAAAVIVKNPGTALIVFNDEARWANTAHAAKSVGQLLASFPRTEGGTDTTAPFRLMLEHNVKFDNFIMVSDDMGWIDTISEAHAAWGKLKQSNPEARRIMINVQPGNTRKLPGTPESLHVGGFSDSVFSAISSWLTQNKGWVSTVNGE